VTEETYVPVACEYYDNLTAAAMRKTFQCFTVKSEGDHYENISGVVVDLYSDGGVEYMKLLDGRIFRLDHTVIVGDQDDRSKGLQRSAGSA